MPPIIAHCLLASGKILRRQKKGPSSRQPASRIGPRLCFLVLGILLGYGRKPNEKPLPDFAQRDLASIYLARAYFRARLLGGGSSPSASNLASALGVDVAVDLGVAFVLPLALGDATGEVALAA